MPYYKDGGKYLKKKCCCDDGECPDCPPLASLPKLCRLRLDTPEVGEVHLYKGVGAPDAEWTLLAVDAEDRYGFPEDHCVYIWKDNFVATECVGTCEEITPDVPFETMECEYHYTQECPSLANPEVNITVDVTETRTLSGVVRFAERKLVWWAKAQMMFAYDCTEGKKYRWIRFTYVYDHALAGRLIGEEVHHIEADDGQPDCVNNVLYHLETDWNTSGITGCDHCPSFQNVTGEGIPSEDRWYNDCASETGNGMYYGGSYGVIADDEGWVEVADFFVGYSADTYRGFGLCFGNSNPFIPCSQSEETLVYKSADNTEWTYNPLTTFDFWTCQESYDDPGCWIVQGDAFPPSAATIDHTIPLDCSYDDPECDCDSTALADLGGESYDAIPVAFDTLSGTCTHSQPNEAEPC